MEAISIDNILISLQRLMPNDGHNLRYAKSIDYILRYCHDCKTAVEIGYPTTFTKVLKQYMPHVEVFHIKGDVRKPLQTVPENLKGNVDLIIFMEVMEHLADLDSNDIEIVSTYTGSGIKGFFDNARTLLKRTGKVFLTTPNVISYKNIFNLMYGAHPYFYALHTRELSPVNVKNYIENNGFEITVLATETVWNNHGLPHHIIESIQKCMQENKCSTKDRGDDIFAIATLP